MYAANGGNKSQNYTYAGSNTPGDVAWYSANCSSKQKVKTKAPNELGLYDMSGNVGEFVSTMYSSKYPYIYGGAYCSKSQYVTKISSVNTYSGGSAAGYNISNAYQSTCNTRGAGFRLMLSFK